MGFFNLVTETELNAAVKQLQKEIRLMASQADVDALTQTVNQVSADLETTKSTLQTEIDNLASANPSLDLTALQAAVAPLDSAVQALGALQPTPATPPADAPPATS